MIAAQVSEEKLQHAAGKYLWHYIYIFCLARTFLCAISHRQGITHQASDDTVRAQVNRIGQQGIKTQQSFLLLLNP